MIIMDPSMTTRINRICNETANFDRNKYWEKMNRIDKEVSEEK